MKYFDKKNNCLVFINTEASADFWDAHWESDHLLTEIKNGKNDRFISKITKNFIPIPKNKRILEGGCGKGQFVYSLQLNGYDAYGIDYARKTIEKINKIMPRLKVSYGNVEKLDFPDNFFDGYWSLGVIEHFFDSYAKIASEMRRVIKPGGYLFLTFPYMSPLRKFKAKHGKYPKFQENNFNKETFYQFALDHKKVIEKFELSGFSLVSKKPFDGIKGLKDEVNFMKNPLQKIYDSRNIFCKIISFSISKFFYSFSSHSILLVFKKND
ncbi:MAG: methyltransferase domain-containing protein [Candidatus Moranbacteria bacterium]|nr:methyltransferase domain-containing protein [Candidatus Moranbacteria bacterium]